MIRILFYAKENKFFQDRIDPKSKLPVKSSQLYVLFYEIIFPPQLINNYLEEFNKIQGFSKDLTSEEKVLNKVKIINDIPLADLQSKASLETIFNWYRGYQELDKSFNTRKNVIR